MNNIHFESVKKKKAGKSQIGFLKAGHVRESHWVMDACVRVHCSKT